MAKKKKKTKSKSLEGSPCVTCMAACCRYVATEIDEPESKQDYDHIRWYLHHRNVYVFIDNNGRWFLEFDAECDQLEPDHRCGIYHDRPRICQLHGEEEIVCEFMSDEEPHDVRFTTAEEFEDYLDEQGIVWRWKKSAAQRDKARQKRKRT